MAGQGVTDGRTASGTARFALIDALRAIAALSVLVFHASYSLPGHSGLLWNTLTQQNAGPPVTGVVLFFVISGFVLYRPFALARAEGGPAPPLVPYAVRRFARIVPAFWVALAIVTVWMGLSEVQSAKGVIRYFGFLQLYGSARTAQGGIGAAWTLCVEVTFYAALPLLALGLRRLRGAGADLGGELALCALLLALSIAWQVAVTATVPRSDGRLVPLLWTLPGSFGQFAAGMALAAVTVQLARRPGVPRWAALLDRRPWVAWLLAAMVFYAVGRLPELIDETGFGAWYVGSTLFKVAGSALLLAPVVVGTREGLLRRALGWRPVLWLGTISYGVYLWHQPLILELAPKLVPHGQLLAMVLLLALSITAGWLSYVLVERPAQRIARAVVRRRAEPGRAVAEPATAAP